MRLNWSDHVGLARRQARRLARPGLDLDDAEQICVELLWRVCQGGGYDPARGAPSTYLVSELRRARTPARRAVEVVRGARHVASLDVAVGDDDDSTMHEVIAGPAEPPEDLVGDLEARRRLRDLVGALPPLERAALALRFGLDGREPLKLAEVGHELGISAERARQLELGALHRLRARLGNR